MPVLTPSRVAIVVLTLSLLSFLWTFGLPQQLAEPSLPLINHDAPGQKPNQPAKVEPNEVFEDFGRPYVPPGSPRHTPIKAPEASKPTPTPQPKPAESKIPEVTGEEDKKGKVDDKQKEKEKPKENATPAPAPATTVTSALAPFPTTASINATVKAPIRPTKFCKDVHGAPDVMVIVKTSKAEIQDKLPTHLKTLLSCVPNFLIFSDHAGTIDGFTVHDALDTITNATKTSHKEFNEYEKIQQDKNYKPDAGKTKDLDKWKFLPMVYKAHKMRPYARFCIFIEADTSLSWTNLLQWMDRLDYRIPYYSGAPTYLNDIKFAQRGSGIMLSYGALKQYAKMYDERYESEWEKRVGKECCGDMVLATTLIESHVEFYSSFPLLQGETPATLDWTDRHWCAPIVSWHHMTPTEIDLLWSFQSNWTSKNGWELPHLFRNAFDDFVLPHLEETKDGWDNLSQDTKIVRPKKQDIEEKKKEKELKDKLEREKQEKENAKQKEQVKDADDSTPEPKEEAPEKSKGKETRDDAIGLSKFGNDIDSAAENAENCKHLCEITEDCLQWKFTSRGDQECFLGKVMRLGRKADKKGSEEGWTSGWMLDKIKKVTGEWNQDCKDPKWKFNQ